MERHLTLKLAVARLQDNLIKVELDKAHNLITNMEELVMELVPNNIKKEVLGMELLRDTTTEVVVVSVMAHRPVIPLVMMVIIITNYRLCSSYSDFTRNEILHDSYDLYLARHHTQYQQKRANTFSFFLSYIL